MTTVTDQVISDQIASTVSLTSESSLLKKSACALCESRVNRISQGTPVQFQCSAPTITAYTVTVCCVPELYEYEYACVLCIDVAALWCEHGAARRGKAGGREGSRTELRWTQASGGHSAHAAYVAFDSCIREQRSSS